MILSLLRTPTSYFRPYRGYFVAIYGIFLAFPAREIVLFFLPEEQFLRFFTQLMVGAAVAIAVLWGHLVTRLYTYPQEFSFKKMLANAGQRVNLGFFLYLVPMAVTLVSSFLVPDVILVRQEQNALYVVSATNYRVVGYSTAFLAVASTVIVAFVLYPITVLVHLRSQLKDRDVRHALKVIALCFGAISILLLAFNAVSALGYSVLGPVHMASVSLLIIVVHEFSKPTFLKAFLGVIPALEPIPTSRKQDQIVLVYNSQQEKLGPISRYISEGVNQQFRVVYFHHEDEAFVRDGLAKKGLNIRQHILKGNLRLSSLAGLYQGEGILDEEAAIESCQELASEARKVGKEGVMIVIDYGDQTKRPSRKFVEHLTDARWSSADHSLKVLMTFSKTAFQGQENALAMLKAKTQVLNLSESMDLFSRTVGLSHHETAGKKILLEFDPLSDYERVLISLLEESTSNFERVIVFTRRDSPLYSVIGDRPGLKTFVLTSRVSYPKVESENRVLLPAYDSSLLLDAFNKTVEAYGGASFTMLFDSISHYVHTLGPERAHSLVRQALELMVSDTITGVFLLNLGAHDQKTLSTFENLFDLELVCRQDARIPEIRRKLGLTA